MAAQPRQFPSIGRTNAGVDTTLTKIFVGGLAWETQDHTMRRYFDQFGEILEAVVITDKHTGRSKGYGFVTFKDPDSAMRACHDPTPVIDGRRANCNLASIGAAQRTPQHGIGRFRPPTVSPMAPRGPNAAASTAYFHPHAQHAYPYSFYGYSGGYSQQSMHPMSYYGIGRGQQQQQYSPYYPASPGFFHGFYPYYPQYAHSTQTATGFVPNYAQIPQYPYYGSGAGIISLPSSIAAITTGGAPVVTIAAGSTSQQRGVIPDLKPPA